MGLAQAAGDDQTVITRQIQIEHEYVHRLALKALRDVAAVGCAGDLKAFMAQAEDDIVEKTGVVFDHKYVNHRG
jgi:hypothetical protein